MGWRVAGRLKREGTYVYLCLIHTVVWQKPTQCLKELSSNLKHTHTTKKNPFFSLKSIVFLHFICISILSYLAESISFFFFNFTVWEKSISFVPSNIGMTSELSFVYMIGKVLHYF